MTQISAFWAGIQDEADHADWVGLAQRLGGWEAIAQLSPEALLAEGLAPSVVGSLQMARSRESLGHVLTLADPRYPARLAAVPRPPPVLCVDGDPSVLQRPTIAIVGTRACTRYGASVASNLAAMLARAGVLVLSGLARGIDGEAHRGALLTGQTAAVLGHGLAHTAPRLHTKLRAAILASGGAMISNFPDPVPPRPHTFLERNRWIAGLADVVVVVEAPEHSGALHTAGLALEIGREVFAVPGPIDAPASRGCNRLLAEGATPLVDLSAFVDRVTGTHLPRPEGWLEDVLAGSAVEVVAKRYQLSCRELLVRLTRLELEGEVVRQAGGRYILAHQGSERAAQV